VPLPAASTLGSSACTLLAPPPRPRPPASRPACRRSFHAFHFASAVRVGVQPAAELGHVQRHNHGEHVYRALRACPCQQQLGPLPARCLRRRRAHALPPPGPPVAALFMLSLSPRQYANAFNQPLSWDTSSVTTMHQMFHVCSARAPPSSLHSWVLCLHAACAAAAPTPSRLPVPPFAALFMLSLSPRQSASAFNQPLSFDTSSVTDMLQMFYVRSARAPASSLHTWVLLLAPSPRLRAHALLPLCPPVAALFMLPFSTRQSASAFNQSLSWDTSSVRNMYEMFIVRSARAPASRLHSWVLCLHPACAASAPTPSRVPARLSPLFLCFSFRLGSTRQRSTSR